jgi:mevalonate kinase
MALPWTLSIDRTPGPRWDFPGLGPHREAVEALVDRLTALGTGRDLPPPVPGTLEFTTAVPLGGGFGSSGALCAALVNLFWPGAPLEARDRLAWEAEAQFHGTPSGIDTCLALREGWWALDASVKPVAARPLADPGLVLVVGGLVREGDTKSLVAGLARRRQAGDSLVTGALGRLGATADRATRCLESGSPAAFPALVAAARDDLRLLGLETPALTAVLDGAAATGALAGKLSGAGAGGAFFLVYPDRPTAEAALAPLSGLVAGELWTKKPTLI